MARGCGRQKLIEERMLDREAAEGRGALNQFPLALLACLIMCTPLLNRSSCMVFSSPFKGYTCEVAIAFIAFVALVLLWFFFCLCFLQFVCFTMEDIDISKLFLDF